MIRCIFHFLLGLKQRDENFLPFVYWFWTILTRLGGIFIKILVVWMRLFLGSTTFYPFFSWFFYDLVNFFVKNSRPIVSLSVFSTFYWFWKKVTKFFISWEYFVMFSIFVLNICYFLIKIVRKLVVLFKKMSKIGVFSWLFCFFDV